MGCGIVSTFIGDEPKEYGGDVVVESGAGFVFVVLEHLLDLPSTEIEKGVRGRESRAMEERGEGGRIRT